MAKLVLVHWDEGEAMAWARELEAQGWEVVPEWRDGSEAYRLVRTHGPAVVVVSLEQRSDHAMQLAEAVRRSRWGHEVPFIFVGGDDEDALLTLRDVFPEATYVERHELAAATQVHLRRPGPHLR